MKRDAPIFVGYSLILIFSIGISYTVYNMATATNECFAGECANGYESINAWRGPKEHMVFNCMCESTDSMK